MGTLQIEKDMIWSDYTQDIIDKFLESNGYNYKNEKYTETELKQFFDLSVKDNNLKKKFDVCFEKNIKRKLSDEEFKYHILVTLRMDNPMDRSKIFNLINQNNVKIENKIEAYVGCTTHGMEERMLQFQGMILVDDRKKKFYEGKKISNESFSNMSIKDSILNNVLFSENMIFVPICHR